MHLHQILEELAFDGSHLPREAIEAAVVNREEITPHLLKILQEAVERVDEVIENDNYQGHLYAIYLLAQFRETKAFPLICQLISFPGEIPHILTGDLITEDLSRILASVAKENIVPIKILIENRSINEYVRAACLSCLVTMVGCGLRKREEIIEYFRHLFQDKLEKKASFVWETLIFCATELYPAELIEEIKNVFGANLSNGTLISLAEIEKILLQSKESHLLRLYQNATLIDDTVTEMEKWLTPHN
jgi:hypothetical protein